MLVDIRRKEVTLTSDEGSSSDGENRLATLSPVFDKLENNLSKGPNTCSIHEQDPSSSILLCTKAFHELSNVASSDDSAVIKYIFPKDHVETQPYPMATPDQTQRSACTVDVETENDKWQCPLCTLLNSSSADQMCVACGFPARSSLSNLPDEHADEDGKKNPNARRSSKLSPDEDEVKTGSAKRRRRQPAFFKELEIDHEDLRMFQQAVVNSRTENLNVDIQIGEGQIIALYS